MRLQGPLRSIVSRNIATGEEHLACGHTHTGSRRPAQRRRCSACDVSDAMVVEGTPVVAKGEPVARCGYCLEDVCELEPTHTCQCGSVLHKECRRELGRCPTLGCYGTTAVVARKSRIVVAPVPVETQRTGCFPVVLALEVADVIAIIAVGIGNVLMAVVADFLEAIERLL